jgi:hypothetical protein
VLLPNTHHAHAQAMAIAMKPMVFTSKFFIREPHRNAWAVKGGGVPGLWVWHVSGSSPSRR